MNSFISQSVIIDLNIQRQVSNICYFLIIRVFCFTNLKWELDSLILLVSSSNTILILFRAFSVVVSILISNLVKWNVWFGNFINHFLFVLLKFSQVFVTRIMLNLLSHFNWFFLFIDLVIDLSKLLFYFTQRQRSLKHLIL